MIEKIALDVLESHPILICLTIVCIAFGNPLFAILGVFFGQIVLIDIFKVIIDAERN